MTGVTGAAPLAGVTVIELASYIAAPAAATILSDFGATIVKVEPPGAGDPYRGFARLPGMPVSDRNYPWLLDARNKQSVVLDLRVPEARPVMDELVARADVFVTNLAPSSLAALELTYADLGPANPRLIYASFTGYGEVGDDANRPGFDVNAWWARSGMMDLFRAPTAPPPLSLPGMGDHSAALSLFGAIVLGLYRRALTGRGGHVRSSLMANGIWANAVQVQAMLCGATVRPRPPREEAPSALANRYQTRDGRWFLLTLLQQERDWPRLLAAIGREDLGRDPRFANAEARRAHARELVRSLDGVFAGRTWSEWRRVLQEHDLTFEAVQRLQDLRDDAQMAAAGALVPLADDDELRTVGSPLELVGVTKRPAGRAPLLGEHTDGVLRELGYDDGDLARLRDRGVFGRA